MAAGAGDDAYGRGRLEAQVEGRLRALERTAEDMDHEVTELARIVDKLGTSVSRLDATVQQRDAVNQALAQAVEHSEQATREQAGKALTSRQFYLGLGSFLVGFGGMTAGIVAALH